jgi:hypothetical protein
LPAAVGIENREANLVVKIAGKDRMLVDYCDDPVKHYRRSGLRSLAL